MNRLVFGAGVLMLALTLGFFSGTRVCEARHTAKLAKAQAEILRAANLASEKEQARLALEQQLDLLARELEDEARNDPGAGACGISVDSVRRLNKY